TVRSTSSSRSIALGATFALAALAVLTSAAHAASSSAGANATIYKATSVSIAANLSTGSVKTKGNDAGNLTVPATYPLSATPAPTYDSALQKNGANGADPNAARIDVTGQPGAAFNLNFQSWTLLSGQAGSSASGNTY